MIGFITFFDISNGLGVLTEKPQIQGCQAQTRVASIFHMTFLDFFWYPLIALP